MKENEMEEKKIKSKKEKLNKKLKNKQGITLIALIVTIIVLLILAGVSIAMLTGDNGILTQAQNAKNRTEKATLEEKIKLLATETIINEQTGESGEMTAQELEDKLNEQGENVLVVQWDKYIIFDLDENKEYRVMSDGNVEYWKDNTMGNILKNITDVDSTLIGKDSQNKNIVGVDYEGNPVNMNFWECTLYDGTYALNDLLSLTSKNDSDFTSGYIADEDGDREIDIEEDGSIKGTMPQYIRTENENNWIAVTNLRNTFRFLSDLKISPVIPDTAIKMDSTFCDTDTTEVQPIPKGVIDMTGTFGRCRNLEIAPELPNTVKNMASTFYECSKLTEMPIIPESVEILTYTFQGCIEFSSTNELPDNIINMSNTFVNCSNLINIKNLPQNVENMEATFYGCTKLENVPDIPSNVQNLNQTFRECTSLSNVPKILSNKVTSMQSTFSGCSSITTAPEIPESVENMHGTFENCASLTTPPSVIPQKVKSLVFTFSNCSNLGGEMQINANINGSMTSNNFIDYHGCFYNACTNGKGLTILKTSETSIEMLNKLKDSNQKIIIQN